MKPIPVQAIQFDGHNIDQIIEFGEGKIIYCAKWHASEYGISFPSMVITVSQGVIIVAHIGDFIIKDQYGEFKACVASEFNDTYEEYEVIQ